MSKWSGTIGFKIPGSNLNGIYTDIIEERKMKGDLLQFTKRETDAAEKNPGVALNCKISIVADPYVNNNISNIVYVTYLGNKWTVSNAELQFPRLLLTFGGLYNG